MNSKLLHLFIFFRDQKVKTASSKDATAFERHNEVDTGRAPSSQILYRPVLADHSNVPDLCNGPVSTTSNTSNTHAHDFEEVNEIIEKCGCLSPSLWPKWICNNIDAIAKRATDLFPSSDPRNVLLFAAFKIHPGKTTVSHDGSNRFHKKNQDQRKETQERPTSPNFWRRQMQSNIQI